MTTIEQLVDSRRRCITHEHHHTRLLNQISTFASCYIVVQWQVDVY